jgi:hypothetical protein
VDVAAEEKEENKKTEIKWETGKKMAKEEKEKEYKVEEENE